MIRAAAAVMLCLGLATSSTQAGDDVWPQWRGPSRDCHVDGPAWPAKLPEKMTPLWREELGPSYSGPIVTPDRVFVTETANKTNEVVTALDRKTGEQLWQAQWEGAMTVPFFAASNGSWIRSTPAWDGERLYVGGMLGVLVCLNSDNGEELWRIDFVRKYKVNRESFGFVCSPLVHGDHVYVQCCAGLVKLDRRTGDVVWRSMSESGGMMGGAFSSPIVAELGGKPQLVAQSRSTLAGIDLESGKVRWSKPIPSFRGMNILTPTVVGDSVFTSSYRNAAWMFDVENKGGSQSLKEKWSSNAQAYMSSPVVVNDHIYVHLQNQRFACIDAKTGKRKWSSSPFGKYWSMVAQGDRILALDERGELLLIRATPEKFDLIDRKKISTDPTWAHLAVAGNTIFIRELNAQTAYEWK